MDRRERIVDAVGVFLAALLARAVVLSGTYAIGVDSAAFLRMAELIEAGRWREALSTYYHPAYPALAAAFSPLLGGVEPAAYAVSLMAGALASVPLFLIARDLLGRPAALAAGVLYAMHGFVADLQADVKTEPLYLACFLGALWCGWKVISTPRFWWAVPAGLLAGGAYLTRNEGILAVAGLTCWFGFEAIRRFASPTVRDSGRTAPGASSDDAPSRPAPAGPESGAGRPESRTVGDLVMAIPILAGTFLIVSMPFLLWVRDEVGRWALTAKGSGVWLERIVQGQGRIGASDPLSLRTLAYFAKLHHWVLLIPLGVGLSAGWKRPPWERLFLLSFPVVYLLAVFYNIRNMGYTSQRYLVPSFVMLLPFVGAGLVRLAARAPGPKAVLTVAVAALSILVGGRLFGLNRWEDQPDRAAGAWIRARFPGRARILSTSDKLAWYAGGENVRVGTKDENLARADFIAFDERELKDSRRAWIEEAISDRRVALIQEDFSMGRRGQKYLRLYRVLPEPQKGP